MVNNSVKPDLSVNIGDFRLKNPIITASGTYGYVNEYEDFVNLENIGAIVTKGITLNPKVGNPQPRIGEVRGGLINCIGLENVGIHVFVEKKLPILLDKKINFIVNIAGASINEYAELAKICESNKIKAIELNVSCPNVEKGCLEFGRDKEHLYQLVSGVRQIFSGCLIVKLSPNVSNPSELALIVEKAQADAISAINTVKAMQVNAKIENGKLLYSSVRGGLSGSVIKPVALNFIHEIRQAVSLPIIGMGGISNISDILEFLAVGCCCVQVGTANFTHPYIVDQLVQELEDLLIKHNISSFKNLIEKKGI